MNYGRRSAICQGLSEWMTLSCPRCVIKGEPYFSVNSGWCTGMYPLHIIEYYTIYTLFGIYNKQACIMQYDWIVWDNILLTNRRQSPGQMPRSNSESSIIVLSLENISLIICNHLSSYLKKSISCMKWHLKYEKYSVGIRKLIQLTMTRQVFRDDVHMWRLNLFSHATVISIQ